MTDPTVLGTPVPASAGGPPNPNPTPAPSADGGAQALADAAAGAAPKTPENDAWYGKIQSEQVRTWAEAKGWKDPLAAVESAYNLEKLVGFEKAGKTVVIPDEKSTPEQISAFRAKIGVPEKSDGYKLPIPEGASPEFAKTASQWFHEAGVPASAAEKVAGKWNEFQTKLLSDQEAAFGVQSKQDLDKLKVEFGQAYDQNLELGKRAARQFIPAVNDAQRDEILGKIQRAVGTELFVKIFANAGQGLSEHKVHGGGDSGGILTPAQAKQRIAELTSNKEWASAYAGGDKAKLNEMTDLQKQAYPPSLDAA